MSEENVSNEEKGNEVLADVIGSKLDDDAIFVKLSETNCKLCRYYNSKSDNVCIQNCERLELVGYYR